MNTEMSQKVVVVDSLFRTVETKKLSLGLRLKFKAGLLTTALLLWYGSGRAAKVC